MLWNRLCIFPLHVPVCTVLFPRSFRSPRPYNTDDTWNLILSVCSPVTYLIHREIDKWMLEVSLSAFLLRLEAGCVCLKETVIPYSP